MKKSYSVLIIIIFFSLGGCAHFRENKPNPNDSRSNFSDANRSEDTESRDKEKRSGVLNDKARSGIDLPAQENRVIFVNGMKLKNGKFDIPITVNSKVEQWINYFCGKGRMHFERYLERSEFFIPYIIPILRENGMPEDLVYLAMVESGFNNLARSRARAVGPWQFISATGKRYGLSVNWWIDERRDIRKSTLAAVQYLKDLYNIFGVWELSAAAYNAGEAKVARAVQRFGTKDFWSISRHRFLKPETRDYVPKIIAAALIAKNREQFGFSVNPPPLASDEAIAPSGELVKVIKTEVPEETMDANPDGSLKSTDSDDQDSSDIIATSDPLSPPENGEIRATEKLEKVLKTPESATESDGKAIAKLTEQTTPSVSKGQVVSSDLIAAKSIPTPNVSKDGQVSGERVVEFDVKSPADLLKIAKAAGLSYVTVKNLNPELMRWCTPPQANYYRVKLPASTKERFLLTYNQDAFAKDVSFLTYRAKRGETLAKIARHFGIRVDPLSELNRFSANVPLKSGTPVVLPIPNDRTRSAATLDLKDPPEKRRYRRGRKYRHPKDYRISYKRREASQSLRRIRDPMVDRQREQKQDQKRSNDDT